MLTAIIKEQECIGCGICLDACPFDAIIGAKGFMHTIISTECIGCKLCLDPCPVDCIDIVPMSLEKIFDKKQMVANARNRRVARIDRIKSTDVAQFAKQDIVLHDLQAILLSKK